MRWRTWLLVAAALLLAACEGNDAPPDSEPPTTSVPEPTSMPTPTLAIPTPPGTEPPPPEMLTIWLVDEVRADGEAPAAVILGAQLAAFQSNHPELTLKVEVKSAAGQGGSLSYLRAGRGVATAILPDMVVLPSELLSTAWSERLVFALDELLPPAAQEDLFPAARAAATVDDVLVAYPLGLTALTHVVYSTAVITGTMPATWDALMAREGARYAIPGASTEGAKLALQLYLDLGGTLLDETGQRRLELDALTRALALLNRGRTEGLIPIQSSNLATFGEVWQFVQSGSANIALIDAHEYLTARQTAARSAVASAPGVDGPITPLIHALSWTVTTPDAARQALAAELLNWLVDPQNLGEWSLAARILPGRRQALDVWPSDGYPAFVRGEIERAEPFPGAAGSVLMAALNQAVYDVLTGAMSPAAAAEAAVAALQG